MEDQNVGCPICYGPLLVPVLIIHKPTEHSPKKTPAVCRTLFCEECVFALDRCPMCNLDKDSYLVQLWRVDLDGQVNCPHENCTWMGTNLVYYTSHSLDHIPALAANTA